MKKFLSTIGIAIGVPILFTIVNMILSIIFFTAHCAIYKTKITNPQKATEIITQNMYIISALSGLIMFLLLILIFLPTKESLFKRCNFKAISFSKVINIIILIIGVTFINSIFVAFLTSFFTQYNTISQQMVNASNSVFQILCVVLIIPIFEEIIFRGVIFGFLKKNFNMVIAIIVQALIFAIMHGNIVQGIYTFILGVILALINIYGNSLYGNIIAHVTFNIFGILIIPYIGRSFPYAATGIIFLLVGICFITFGVIKIVNTWSKANIY